MHFDFTRGKNTFLQIKTFATLWRIYYMPSMKNNCSDNAEMYYWNAVQFGVEVQKQGRMLQRLYSLGFSLSITSMLFTWLQLYKRQYHFQSEGKFWQQPFVSMIGHLYQNQSPCGNPQPLKIFCLHDVIKNVSHVNLSYRIITRLNSFLLNWFKSYHKGVEYV